MTRETWEDLGCGMLTLLGIAAVVFAIGLGRQFLASAGMPATIAKVEQLRLDSAQVDPAQAEDVIGQVIEWNQRIRSNQAMNDTWYLGWITPDEWDAIEPIAVPR